MSRGKAPNARGPATLRQKRTARNDLPQNSFEQYTPPKWGLSWFNIDVDDAMGSIGFQDDAIDDLSTGFDLKMDWKKSFKGNQDELDEYVTAVIQKHKDDKAVQNIFKDILHGLPTTLHQKMGVRPDEQYWNMATPLFSEDSKLEAVLHALLNHEPNSEASRNLRQLIYSTVFYAMEEIATPSNPGAQTDISPYDYSDLLDVQRWLLKNPIKNGDKHVSHDDKELIEVYCDPDPVIRHSGVVGVHILNPDGRNYLEDEEHERYHALLTFVLKNNEVSNRLKTYDEKLHRDLSYLKNRCFS